MQENQEQNFNHSEQSLNQNQNPNRQGLQGVEDTEKLQNFEGAEGAETLEESSPERANFNPADDGELDEEYSRDSGIGGVSTEKGNPVQ